MLCGLKRAWVIEVTAVAAGGSDSSAWQEIMGNGVQNLGQWLMAKCRSRRTTGWLLLDTGGVLASGKDRRADRKELHTDLFHTVSLSLSLTFCFPLATDTNNDTHSFKHTFVFISVDVFLLNTDFQCSCSLSRTHLYSNCLCVWVTESFALSIHSKTWIQIIRKRHCLLLWDAQHFCCGFVRNYFRLWNWAK